MDLVVFLIQFVMYCRTSYLEFVSVYVVPCVCACTTDTSLSDAYCLVIEVHMKIQIMSLKRQIYVGQEQDLRDTWAPVRTLYETHRVYVFDSVM